MEIILFKDKSGMCKCETTQIHGDKITFKFIGAPAYAVVSFIGTLRSTRRTLSTVGECEVDIDQLLGDIKIAVSHKGKIWTCDGIHVERDDVGNVRISSLTNYPEKFGFLLDEIAEVKAQLEKVTDKMQNLLTEIERAKKDYKII